MSNFHSYEIVGRGSETQLQVGPNLNKISDEFTPADLIYYLYLVPIGLERGICSGASSYPRQSTQKVFVCYLQLTIAL